MDQGYVAGHTLADSQQEHGITLLGPVAADTSWQAHQPDGLTADQFDIDWQRTESFDVRAGFGRR